MPAPADWQNAIRAAGFHAEIDTDFDVDKFSGFLPCKYAGRPSGFEYFSSPLASADAVAAGAPAESDFLITFVTHSDFRELATCLAAASTLCKVTDGLLVDPQSGDSYMGSTAIGWAVDQLRELQEHLR